MFYIIALLYIIDNVSISFAGCRPADAQYVAVTAPTDSFEISLKSNAIPASYGHGLGKLQLWMLTKIIASLTGYFTSVLSFIFSNKSQRGEGSKTSVTFCKVRVESNTGTRYFYFRFRRFIYNAASSSYVTGSWDIQEGANIGAWLDSSYLYQGLSEDEAAKRLSIVGPNVLKLKKPTVIGSIYAEFSKPFYLYQNFMIWTWGKIASVALDELCYTCSQVYPLSFQHRSGTIIWPLSILAFELLVAL